MNKETYYDDELRYVFAPKGVHDMDFIREAFRLLKDKQIKAYDEYRTSCFMLRRGMIYSKNIQEDSMGQSSRAIADKDLNRLVAVGGEKKDVALSRLAGWIRTSTSILTFYRIKSFLHEPAFKKHFPDSDMHQLLIEKLRLSDSQWSTIESISHKWASIHDTPSTDYPIPGIVQELVSFWGSKIDNFSKQKSGLWSFQTTFPDMHLYYFDKDVNLVVITETGSEENQFRAALEILSSKGAALKISIVLVLGDGNRFRDLAKESKIDIVVLDEKDCRDIILSPHSVQTFCHQVAGRIPVQTIQPYQTEGPVRARMFYGRDDELKRVRNNMLSNFTIYGGRLVGKSSLLLQIHKIFSADDGYRVCILKAQKLPIVELCRNMLKSLNIPTANYRNNLLTFERLMRDYLSSNTKRILFLLDEMDDVIEEDAKDEFSFFNTMHNLQGENCRFFITGYRQLATHCMNREARLFNFGERILLGSLSSHTARRLIEEPLCNEMGFRFEDDALIEQIIETTGGHPNYIQVFCKVLSESLDDQKRRKITQGDVSTTFENSIFRSKVIDTFHVNFSQLQKLITIFMILDGKTELDLTDITDMIEQYGILVDTADVYMQLRQLELSFIIEQVEEKYRFINKLFPETLEKRLDLIKFADRIMKEMQRGEK